MSPSNSTYRPLSPACPSPSFSSLSCVPLPLTPAKPTSSSVRRSRRADAHRRRLRPQAHLHPLPHPALSIPNPLRPRPEYRDAHHLPLPWWSLCQVRTAAKTVLATDRRRSPIFNSVACVPDLWHSRDPAAGWALNGWALMAESALFRSAYGSALSDRRHRPPDHHRCALFSSEPRSGLISDAQAPRSAAGRTGSGSSGTG
jgi:hypothetical protein